MKSLTPKGKIMIHQYKLNGYNIVLDTCSGSIHAVDEVAYDIIAMFKDETKENIIKTITEKYPEVTEGDVLDCIDDINELISMKATQLAFSSYP